MKRIFCIILSVVLCLTLVMAMGAATSADTADEKQFWRVKVGSVELSDGQCLAANNATEATAGNNGGSYVAYFKDGTLFLNNLTVENGRIYWSARNASNSPLAFDLTLDLTGTNSVTNNSGSAIVGETGWVTGRGMSLTITGDGSLAATGSECGFWVWKDINIRGNAKVTAAGNNRYGICNNSNTGTITIAQNAVVETTGNTYGLGYDNYYHSSAVKLEGGSLTAIGNTAAIRQTPVLGEGVSAQGSAATTGADPENYDSEKNASYKWFKSIYTPPAVYNVTFDSAGGSAVANQTIEEGEKATKPADPTKSGYTFKGWMLGSALYDFNSAVTGNMTLIASWEEIPATYTVTFAANGGTGTMAAATDVSGDYTLPENGFTAPAGKQFKAWSVDGNEKAAGSKINVTKNTTVTALWEEIPPSHTCVIEPVEKAKPSCTEGGKKAYYKCTGCGKFFEDALGATEITDLAAWGNIEKTGHTASNWMADKNDHWKECTAEDGLILENTKAAHKDADADGKCDTCQYEVGTATPGPDDTNKPGKPGETNKPSEPEQSPETGDNSHLGLWIALLIVSGAGLAATVYGKKYFFLK